MKQVSSFSPKIVSKLFMYVHVFQKRHNRINASHHKRALSLKKYYWPRNWLYWLKKYYWPNMMYRGNTNQPRSFFFVRKTFNHFSYIINLSKIAGYFRVQNVPKSGHWKMSKQGYRCHNLAVHAVGKFNVDHTTVCTVYMNIISASTVHIR